MGATAWTAWRYGALPSAHVGLTGVGSVQLSAAQDPPDGTTAAGDVLTYTSDTSLDDVEVVRLVTTFVGDLALAWHEIELLSPTPPG